MKRSNFWRVAPKKVTPEMTAAADAARAAGADFAGQYEAAMQAFDDSLNPHTKEDTLSLGLSMSEVSGLFGRGLATRIAQELLQIDVLKESEYARVVARIHQLLSKTCETYGDRSHLRTPREDAPSCPVSKERGEELLDELQSGMSSPAAQELYQLILADCKDEAIALMGEEGTGGQDAEDLYVYCRYKWASGALVVSEVPLEYAERIINWADPGLDEYSSERPGFLMRTGTGVTSVYVTRDKGQLQFRSARTMEMHGLSEITQLWMVSNVR